MIMFQLFGLKRVQNDNWLAPNDKFSYEYCDANETEKRHPDQESTSNYSFEFRLRFKLPLASKLLEIDKAAFNYYYNQVKADYLNNVVCSADVKAANGKLTYSVTKDKHLAGKKVQCPIIVLLWE